MIPWYGLLILFPLCCGLIGYLTNRLAVKMIFWPVRQRRLFGLRFQGVLPKHHQHFAREMAEVVTSDFMTSGELVDRLDVEAVTAAMSPRVDQLLDQTVDDLRQRMTPDKRPLLADAVVALARKRVHASVAGALPRLLERVRRRADELVDLNELITQKIVSLGPAKFAEQIMDLGHRELLYIVYYGGLLGALIGLVQFGVVRAFPPNSAPVAMGVSLVIVGILVGAVTNYLAIKMLFVPRRPRRLLLLEIQGLFPKRQAEIADRLAQIAAEHFINPKRIFSELAQRLLQELTQRPPREQVDHLLTQRFPEAGATLKAALPAQQYDPFCEQLAQELGRATEPLVAAGVAAAVGQLDVRAILSEKVVALSKLRYEGFVRELFKEEEAYMVIYGGVLGGVMGTLQLALLLLKHWI